MRETDDAVCSAVWLAFGRKTCIYRAAGLASPMLAGLWRPAVYLPEEVQVSELPYVLEHEASHREARDILYVFLLMGAGTPCNLVNCAGRWCARRAAIWNWLWMRRRWSRLMEYRVAYGRVVLDTPPAAGRGRLPGALQGENTR